MNKRAAFFSTDALLAVTILLLLLIISGTFFTKKPTVDHLINQAEDLATFFSKTKASQLSNQLLQNLQADVPDALPSSNTIFIDHSVGEIIAYLWVANQSNLTGILIENLTRDFVNPVYNYGVYIDANELYRRGPIIGKNLASAKRLITGVAQNSPVEGFTARARLSGIRNVLHHQYTYFGGFVGQGAAITRVSDSILPNQSVIEQLKLKLIAGTTFTFSVNEVKCRDISGVGKPGEFEPDPSNGLLDADEWDLVDCIPALRIGDVNNFTVGFVSLGGFLDLEKYYISGGFIDIQFRHDNITFANNVTQVKIPAVTDGVPNIRGNIPIKGSLKSMSMGLKYAWNHTKYDHGRLFVVVGNKTVFNDTASVGNQSIIVNASAFAQMFPSGLSNTNVPYYIGVDHFKGFEGENINGDVVIALDSSESYDQCMVDGYEPSIKKASCTDPKTGTDYCCAALQDVSATKCPVEACYREVINVDDGYVTWCQDDISKTAKGYRLLWRFMTVQDQDTNSLGGSVVFSGCKIIKSLPVSLEDSDSDSVTIDGVTYTSDQSVILLDPDNSGYNLFQAVYNIFSEDLNEESSKPLQVDFDFKYSASLSPKQEQMADFDGFVLELDCPSDVDFRISVDSSDYDYYAGMHNQSVVDHRSYSGPVMYNPEQENHLKSNVIRNDSVFFADELARFKSLKLGVVEATGVGMPAEFDAGEAFSLNVNRRNQNNWLVSYTENCYSWKPKDLVDICPSGTPNPNKLQAYSRTGGIIASVSESPANQYTPNSPITIPVFANEEVFYRSKWVEFNQPYGVVLDSSGNLFIADTGNNLIRKMTPQGFVTTFAGGFVAPANTGNCPGLDSTTCFDATGINAQFNAPSGLAIDGSNNIYVADKANFRIRKISPAGVVTTIAGDGVSGFPSSGGPALSSNLLNPEGVAVDAFSNVFVSMPHGIVKITASGMLQIIAGSDLASPVYNPANGIGSAASFNAPKGLAVYNGVNAASPVDDILYVADFSNAVIRKVTLSNNGVTTHVGGWSGGGSCGGIPTASCNDGVGGGAQFQTPMSLSIDQGTGIMAVTDKNNNCIRYVDTNGFVGTWAGLCVNIAATGAGNLDGPLNSAKFQNPKGIVYDGGASVYVTTDAILFSLPKYLIRKITLSAPSMVSTVAGGGQGGGACGGLASATCSDSPPSSSPTWGTTFLNYVPNTGGSFPITTNSIWRSDYAGVVLPEDGVLVFPAGVTQWTDAMIGLYGYPNGQMQSFNGVYSVTFGGARDFGAVTGFFGPLISPLPRYEIPASSNPMVMSWVGGATDFAKKSTYTGSDHVFACLDSNTNSVCDFVEPGFSYTPSACPAIDEWHHPFNAVNDVVTSYQNSLNHGLIVYDPLDDGVVNTLNPVNPNSPSRDTLVNYVKNTKSWQFDCVCCALHRAGKMIDPNYNLYNLGVPATPYPDQKRAVVLISDGILGNVSCSPAIDGMNPEISAYLAAARLSGFFWDTPIPVSYSPLYSTVIPGYGARVFVIGVGARRNDFVLQTIAWVGNGSYYTAENDDQLKDAFVAIADELRNATQVYQLINNTQVLVNASHMYRGSFFEVDVNPVEKNQWFGKMPWYQNKELDAGCNPTASFDSVIQQIVDASLVTYTRYYWLLNASISHVPTYDHFWWQPNISMTGDPSALWLPPDRFFLNNSVQELDFAVGAESSLDPDYVDCSADNELHAKVLLGTIGNSSPVLPGKNGCSWIIEIAGGSSIALKIPRNYNGPLVCRYTTDDISYLRNESMHVAVANLLSLLDLGSNGDIVDIDFNSIDIDLAHIEKVPYLFGPLEFEVRVWQ